MTDEIYILKLYITGHTARSEEAIRNMRRICEGELQGQYDLEIIDVLENTPLAENEKILATPMVIRKLPPPIRRIVGDLSDREKVLLGLDIQPREQTGGTGS